jgi:hypothetical protein
LIFFCNHFPRGNDLFRPATRATFP